MSMTLSGDGQISTLVGQVCFFGMTTAPAGFLACNGAAVSRTTYAALFAAIGTTYGSGDGFSTFTLPDLRGEFIRGWDDGRGVDTSRAFGSTQDDAFESHKHVLHVSKSGGSIGAGPGLVGDASASISVTSSFARNDASAAMNNTGGTETRPRNVALLACIKF